MMALSNTGSSMFMSFLRPLALPRASTLTRFLSTSTTSTSSADSTPPPATPSQPTIETKVKATSLPYRVNRTPSQKLPIYLLAKRGGNLKQTRLRKIEGNVAALRQELQMALGLEEKEVVINQLNKHIIIKVRLPLRRRILPSLNP
jgi:large subunit ribosomal protein L49